MICRLIMAAGGFMELVFGIKADRLSLETMTKPLTAMPAERSEENLSDE